MRGNKFLAAGLFILVILAVSFGCVEQEEPVKKEESEEAVKEERGIITDKLTFKDEHASGKISKNKITKTATIDMTYFVNDTEEWTDFTAEKMTMVPFVVNFACLTMTTAFFNDTALEELQKSGNISIGEEREESPLEGYKITRVSLVFKDKETNEEIADCTAMGSRWEDISFNAYRNYSGKPSYLGMEIGKLPEEEKEQSPAQTTPEGETKYVCPDGSTVSDPSLCPGEGATAQQPSEEIAPTKPEEPKLMSNIYAEADIDLAISTGKTLKDEEAWTDFVLKYSVYKGPANSYTIITPYALAASYVRTQVINYDEISRSMIREILESNQINAIIYTKTDEPYFGSYGTEDIRVLIKDGNKIYKADSISAESEISVDDLGYKTTISGKGIPNYEDYAKRTVELIIVVSGKETKFSVDLDKFK